MRYLVHGQISKSRKTLKNKHLGSAHQALALHAGLNKRKNMYDMDFGTWFHTAIKSKNVKKHPAYVAVLVDGKVHVTGAESLEAAGKIWQSLLAAVSQKKNVKIAFGDHSTVTVF